MTYPKTVVGTKENILVVKCRENAATQRHVPAGGSGGPSSQVPPLPLSLCRTVRSTAEGRTKMHRVGEQRIHFAGVHYVSARHL